jgi:hypothetical protein
VGFQGEGTFVMKSSQIESESICASRLALHCGFSRLAHCLFGLDVLFFHFFKDAIDSVMVHANDGILPLRKYLNYDNTMAN